MYVYCLFCRTQRCSRIAQLLEIRGAARAFSPKILSKQRKQGQNYDRERDLLPGYVFIFSEERLVNYDMFAGIDGVIRRVGRTETGYELEGPDREFAFGLLEKDGKVLIEIIPDMDWIPSEGRVYPVRIDPFIFQFTQSFHEDAAALVLQVAGVARVIRVQVGQEHVGVLGL